MIELPTESDPVKVIHGDCLDVLPHLRAPDLGAIVTDPPCGIDYATNYAVRGVGASWRGKRIANDDRPTLPQRILRVLGESPLPVSTPDLVAILCPRASHARQRVWASLRGLERGGLVVRQRQRRRVYTAHTVTLWRLKC